jgi:hypothetical protein
LGSALAVVCGASGATIERVRSMADARKLDPLYERGYRVLLDKAGVTDSLLAPSVLISHAIPTQPWATRRGENAGCTVTQSGLHGAAERARISSAMETAEQANQADEDRRRIVAALEAAHAKLTAAGDASREAEADVRTTDRVVTRIETRTSKCRRPCSREAWRNQGDDVLS